MAAFFASDGSIVIHDGNSWLGRSGIAEMAAGFLSDVPDLFLTCDDVRVSGIKVPWDL